MKVILAFAYFFFSVLVIIGLGWLGYTLAPQDFILNRNLLSAEHGKLKHAESLLPEFDTIVSFQYPESVAGLYAHKQKHKLWLIVFPDDRSARDAFKNYSGSLSEKMGPRQSSTPNMISYRNPDSNVYGHARRINELILHVEAESKPAVKQIIQQSGLLIPNPEANILTEIFYKGRYLWYIVIFIFLYAAIQLPVWNRIGSWAATIHPSSSTPPVREYELKQRLLAINNLDVPFMIREKKNGRLDVVWRLADAKWAGLMTMNKIDVIQIIRLRLSEKESACYAVDITRSVSYSAGGLKSVFSFRYSFFRGINFGRWDYEKQFGLIFSNGELQLNEAYSYQFSTDEMKKPVVDIVTGSGWKYKPVMFL